MTALVDDWGGTSSGSPIGEAKKATISIVLAMGVMATPGTSLNGSNFWSGEGLSGCLSQTAGLFRSAKAHQTQTTAAAVLELRRRSGLTWEQLADVLGVSRRSLHFWASGQRLTADNERHLRKTLGALNLADQGSAHSNREMLMAPHEGHLLVDLLTQKQYEEFLTCAPHREGLEQPTLQPLSQAALDARKPLKPEQLMDSLHGMIHHNIGRGRAARSKLNQPRNSD